MLGQLRRPTGDTVHNNPFPTAGLERHAERHSLGPDRRDGHGAGHPGHAGHGHAVNSRHGLANVALEA
jgi:hypothetical protein